MMRQLVIAVACAVMCAQVTKADTTFVAAGDVFGEWTAENSPYVVQGDLTVPTGEALSIGAGVQVYFDGYYRLSVESVASFSALGTEGDSVAFTTDTLLHPERWAGIHLDDCADTVRFEYCIVEHAMGFEDGAVYSYDARVKAAHTTFRRNRGIPDTDAHGGAFTARDSYLILEYCVFEENTGNHGGAMGLNGGNEGVMRGCIFRNNLAAGGGAMFAAAFDMAVEDCRFIENTATSTSFYGGGAIWFEVTGGGQFTRCDFVGNRAFADGGAIDNSFGGLGDSYVQCRFLNNVSDSLGGAYSGASDQTIFKYCVFAGNEADKGGAVAHSQQYVRILGCTLVGNAAANGGAGIHISNASSCLILNTVVAYNTGGVGIANPPNPVNQPAHRGMRYCSFFNNEGGDLSGQYASYYGEPGQAEDDYHNQYIDPMFVNVEGGDYQPVFTSPLVDAGLYNVSFGLLNDPDDSPPDIGARYFPHVWPNRLEWPNDGTLSGETSAGVQEYALLQNYPNPFNSETTIAFELPSAQAVTLELFDVTGRLADRLYEGIAETGRHQVNVSSSGLSSGVYLYRLRAGEFVQSRKMVVMK